MKKLFLPPFCALLALSACTSDKTSESQPSSTEQGAIAGPLPEPANAPAAGTDSANSTPTASSGSASGADATNSGASHAMTQPTAAAQPSTDYPKGIPVSGKPGYVLSPYAQYAGLVDVRGMASGTVVICPFTQKKFIVP